MRLWAVWTDCRVSGGQVERSAMFVALHAVLVVVLLGENNHRMSSVNDGIGSCTKWGRF